jgi:DNA polymerase III sliding clamp (beta) subunit (PCNA family)
MTFEENRLKNVPSFFLVKGKKVSLPDAFKKIVDRAQTLTGQTFEQERSVTLSIDEGKIVCRGESDLGWVEEDIKTDYKGRALSIRVHPEFLIQILDHLQDVVVGENTLLFEGEDFSHVVMLQAEE